MGAEVAVIDVVNSADIGSNLGEARSRRRNKHRFVIVGVAHGAVDFVTQAIIQRQPWLDLPVILSVETHRVLRDVTVGIAEITVSQVRFSQQQFFDIAGDASRSSRNVRDVILEVTGRHAGAGIVASAVGVSALEVAAQFDGVVALYPGEMFRPVDGLVRPSDQRISLHAANVTAIPKVIEIDVGHAEVSGAERAGVDT